MNQLLRLFFIALVTFLIVLFVTDFQSVVDCFENTIAAISALLSPIKALFK